MDTCSGKDDMQGTRMNIGILAHVDAGKTTLAESILYLTGAIRKAGRVDHKDAYLDTYELEKARGITIFSKMAQMKLGDADVTLLDTPGHVDFSVETERTLQVLDYALLVISGSEGVQPHVRTLWRLLEIYRIPTILFVNKMDQDGTDTAFLMHQLKETLDDGCVYFGGWSRTGGDETPADETLQEELATCEEQMLERYLSGGRILREDIGRLISRRRLFPCYFGSALKMEGVKYFLGDIGQYLENRLYPDEFGARVYKIMRDGNVRLTFMKITGGTLRVRQAVLSDKSGAQKADQIRLYSGSSFVPLQEAAAGTICAVTGLTDTQAGAGLGIEKDRILPVLEPVLSYSMHLPDQADLTVCYNQLRQLEEEIPELRLAVEEQSGTIRTQVMGEVQIEILKALIAQRFGLDVTFGSGRIVYKETIASRVEGVGHYEPLRHYAEVHLVIEPGERGSGVRIGSDVSTDVLDLNWQRLVMTHLQERTFAGTLGGYELTDVRITLVAGKAHLKHTEGGDFRQAVYRAVRQGLMQAEGILLEPVYRFRLEVPSACTGRAMADIQNMQGSFEGPVIEGDSCILTGRAPVACMQEYAMTVRSYTGGRGSLSCRPDGYDPCHNTQEVLLAAGYDPDADTDNPAGSVFCSHGAGMFVPWYEVPAYMHLPWYLPEYRSGERTGGYPVSEEEEETASETYGTGRGGVKPSGKSASYGSGADDKELMSIFERTYGSGKGERAGWKKQRSFSSGTVTYGKSSVQSHQPEALLVDGYNIIFAWDELKTLAEDNLDGARMKLLDILSNYQGYRQMLLIVVFDAYKVAGGKEVNELYHNVYVVYTREAETADAYIERTVHEIKRRYQVTVATSDAAEQIIIWGAGARRQSARELKEEIALACREIQEEYLKKNPGGKRYLFENLDEDMKALLNDVRLGYRKLE